MTVLQVTLAFLSMRIRRDPPNKAIFSPNRPLRSSPEYSVA